MSAKAAGAFLLFGIAAAAAYAYSQQASASTDSNAGTSPDYGGSLFDFQNWLNWSYDSTATDTGIIDPNMPSQPDPMIDFGFFDTIGGYVSSNWKTNEYPKYASAIRDAEISYNIPQDLLARLLYQESRYRADVISGETRSPVGAIGIAQFMPATAKQYGLILANGTDNRTNPFASIQAAARYLSALHRQFNDWKLALMAYNWGPGNVAKWNQNQSGYPVPMETSTYVAQITADVPVA